LLLGLDAGGTHTDAVVIDENRVKAAAKVPTDSSNLLRSVRAAFQEVLKDIDPGRITRLNLSTTLSTNSIIQAKTEDVGVLVSAGPGLDPENYRVGGHYYILGGAIDHRGSEIAGLSDADLSQALETCRQAGVKVFAAVTKFSTRNPDQELRIADRLSPLADFITTGHSLSGVLNFPRRIATAYFNSTVWRIYNDFAWAVEESAQEFGLNGTINMLKADGGTMPLAASKNLPVESIMSGPAASVMGIIALCDINTDSIIMDMGGTTTDIAVFADGAPVIEKEGMTVGSYPTLVRALQIRSIGIGGDSALHFQANRVVVGPDRQGPSLAASDDGNNSDRAPTLTDALNHLGMTQYGDVDASVQGIRKLARMWDLDADDMAEQAVAFALNRVKEAAFDLVSDINDKPVYTIYELLQGKKVNPSKIYLMGGPAQAVAERLGTVTGLDVQVPDHYAYANAVGAALTRTTMETTLLADTRRGELIMPNIGVRTSIPRDYDQARAEEDAKIHLTEYLKKMGAHGPDVIPEISESVTFNTVEGPVASGKNIRVRCQVRPGVDRIALESAGGKG
jgi:N-methylhydantoinase A/oxoprolinase/acetone carboxylase beta subunit